MRPPKRGKPDPGGAGGIRSEVANVPSLTCPPASSSGVLDVVDVALRVPFATPARHANGSYIVLEGELVLRDNGAICPQCDHDTRVCVENFKSSPPQARYVMQATWEKAKRRIIAWLNTQKRRPA